MVVGGRLHRSGGLGGVVSHGGLEARLHGDEVQRAAGLEVGHQLAHGRQRLGHAAEAARHGQRVAAVAAPFAEGARGQGQGKAKSRGVT